MLIVGGVGNVCVRLSRADSRYASTDVAGRVGGFNGAGHACGGRLVSDVEEAVMWLVIGCIHNVEHVGDGRSFRCFRGKSDGGGGCIDREFPDGVQAFARKIHAQGLAVDTMAG